MKNSRTIRKNKLFWRQLKNKLKPKIKRYKGQLINKRKMIILKANQMIILTNKKARNPHMSNKK